MDGLAEREHSFGDEFIFLWPCLAWLQTGRDVYGHGLVQEAGTGIEEHGPLPLGGDITRLFEKLAFGTLQLGFPTVDSSGRKLPQVLVGGVAVLTYEEKSRLGARVVNDHDNDRPGVAYDITAHLLPTWFDDLFAGDVEDWSFVGDLRGDDADARMLWLGGCGSGFPGHAVNDSRLGEDDAVVCCCPMKKPTITIVGAGNLGSALAVRLDEAGYTIREVVSRARSRRRVREIEALGKRVGAKAVAMQQATLDADVLWLTVPDGAIAECANAVAKRGFTSRVVLHSSGALSSDELRVLRAEGASVAAVHPMMSFVAGEPPQLAEVLFSMEGDRKAFQVAKRIVKDLGGRAVVIEKRNKPLYHAFGAFTSPLLMAHFAAAEELAKKAGIGAQEARQAMRPIVLRTLENYFRRGAAKSFSGPLVRGDVDTIRMHWKALSKLPIEADVYRALVLEAIERLPVADSKRIRRVVGDE